MYAIDDLHAEIAYIAYYFHWPLSEILDLEHGERRRYIRQIGTINQHVAGKGGGQGRQGIQA
ncbi:hypothetical protein SSP35_18_00420 [Streptomyces sp. NBRC 110611]|uniref:DUF6760 family protein n=1 Tax=Streptomyces sp. NBRC 110611 TaxID=1621259 RepID=UPI000858185A|nr:DUF6760 family protein [Streptomyces sp. NBRC 110611]GAU70314.1 hypothetical protein SSP35_18_00420 [Streptomyces sp. NBRC 110611]